MTPQPAARSAPRLAATVILLRPAATGFEVLMLRRAEKGDQNSNAWVFPGGLLDAADADALALCADAEGRPPQLPLHAAGASAARWAAAVREVFEESGILLARRRGSTSLLGGEAAGAMAAARAALQSGTLGFADFLRQQDLCIAADQLHPAAHWITPAGMPKRFDTLFFVALVPPGQDCRVDGAETVDHVWLSPERLLAESGRKLLNVTQTILRGLRQFADAQAVLDWARDGRGYVTQTPRRCRDAAGVQAVRQDHPAWAEIGLLDPEGQATAWCEASPGQVTQLWPQLARIRWCGSNDRSSWLLQLPTGGCVAVDPGPTPACREALLRAAEGRALEAVVLTGDAHGGSAAWNGVPMLRLAQASAEALAPFGLAPAGPFDGLPALLWEGQQVLLWPGTQAQAQRWAATAPAGVRWIAPAQGFLVAVPGQPAA